MSGLDNVIAAFSAEQVARLTGDKRMIVDISENRVTSIR